VITWTREFNCASYAVTRINEMYGLDIKIGGGNEWQAKFIPYMRSHFKPSPVKVEKCLVVMSALNGTMHLGIYENYMVTHNYKAAGGAGSVIRSDLGTIRAEFKERVRFYVVN
jgi:hypothetical protein